MSTEPIINYRSKYRLRDRFEQDRFVLERGTDYVIGDSSLCGHIRNYAYKHGYKVSIEECSFGVIVNITSRPKEGNI
jgi:hypothetical protein